MKDLVTRTSEPVILAPALLQHAPLIVDSISVQ